MTDLCVMLPEPDTNEFVVTSLHPGSTREQVRQNTGWDVRFGDAVDETPEPTQLELATLRDLHARTALAHGSAGGGE